LLYLTLPEVFEFYFQNLFSLTQPTGLPTFVLASNPATSEGFRISMFLLIMEFISNNPFTGTGYLGVWILSESHSGSAHVQMLDVLLRTGILGFIAYVFLIYKLLRFLYERESGLFWGLIGILVYGVFHETFKDSQGGFILAFLMGMMAQFKTSVVKADDSRH
jgi:O-antigen ligase